MAVAAGAGIAALSFAVLTRVSTGELAPFFLSNALEQAGGRNVVNVMLVDFRGFDTFGEITVVGIVAIIVYALLRRFRPTPSTTLPQALSQIRLLKSKHLAHVRDPLPPYIFFFFFFFFFGDLKIPAVLVRLLLPLAGAVSLYLLLRGHHEPGGGFVGGLIMATAVIAQYIAGGTIWVESRLRLHPLSWIGFGLLAAAAAGLSGWWLSLPFLTALTADVHCLCSAISISRRCCCLMLAFTCWWSAPRSSFSSPLHTSLCAARAEP